MEDCKADGEAGAGSPNVPEQPSTTTAQEYFCFQCPQGHHNSITTRDKDKYEMLATGEIIVSCTTCAWKSAPFKPALFQHNAQGNVLLWVYTAHDPESIQSTLNISFDNHVPPAKPWGVPPVLATPPQQPTTAWETPRPGGASLPMPAASPVAAVTPQGESPSPEADPADEILHANALDAANSPQEVEEIALKTHRIFRGDLMPEITRYNQENRTVPVPPQEDDSERVDTVEIPIARSRKARHKAQVQPDTTPAFPAVIAGPSWIFQLFQTMLWLGACGAVAFFSLKSCEQQGSKLADAIRTLEIKTVVHTPAVSPSNRLPESATTMPETGREPKVPSPTPSLPSDPRQTAVYQELQNALSKEQESLRKLQETYDALQLSYQSERRSHQELQKLWNGQATLQTDYKRLQQYYQKIVTDLQREFVVELAYPGERDFWQISSSRDGSFFVFYEDQPTRAGKIQKSLKLAQMENGEVKSQELFQTKELQEKQGMIPFVYDWDGQENIVLLARVEGENTLYHIRFQNSAGKVRVALPRKILTVSYPEVLGPPSLSPNTRYVSWVHKTSNELYVEIYNLQTATVEYKAIGGGDTSRIPTWSPDNKSLLFVTADLKGLLAWKIPQEKFCKVFAQEVYGRYGSCSPDGKYVAFFQRSPEGKGNVHLCLWEYGKGEKGEVKILQQDVATTETCRPCWSADSRFLAMIRSGGEDEIAIQDTLTEAIFPVFRRTGKITWVDWSYPGVLAFTYKEGLFTRPYLVRFSSLFLATKN